MSTMEPRRIDRLEQQQTHAEHTRRTQKEDTTMMLARLQPRFTTLSNWNPFEEVAGFRRMFDEPFAGFFREGLESHAGEWKPLMDIVETKDGISLKVEVPGIKQEDISISLEDNTLTVKGERKHESEVNEEAYTRVERSYGTFQRSVLLPQTVDANRVKATYRDGVLEIQLPKKEEARPKAIKVESA
jgi:HSP20 family protein